ncbi:hypothetical protein [Marinifilum flexuosum]|uniref:hypothetical protein n=1 Tax=Marinifilum flexuosum TaxID=1117708 RepID=UPI0024938A6E|nr:hypothetical protein [Marinifilum flexuosum]
MKNLFVILLVLFSASYLKAQRTHKEFKLIDPEQKIEGSLYSKIDWIDSRVDTTNLGFVQLGMFNNKVKVIWEKPFTNQLNDILDSSTVDNSGNGELLLQLRKISFAELTKATSEKGYFYIRAILYAKEGNSYRKLASIDSLSQVKGMDVTKKLLRLGSKTITDFIQDNLKNDKKEEILYSYNDIVELDSYEKKDLKLYCTKEYKDGLYYTYAAFRDQMPDEQPTIKRRKDNSIAWVKIEDEIKGQVKVKSKDVYALVIDGKPLIATRYGYYPLYKSKDYFYFVGDIQSTANVGDVVGASMFFGVLGAIIAAESSRSNYFIVIDHINGGFVLYKELKG